MIFFRRNEHPDLRHVHHNTAHAMQLIQNMQCNAQQQVKDVVYDRAAQNIEAPTFSIVAKPDIFQGGETHNKMSLTQSWNAVPSDRSGWKQSS